MNRIRTHRVPLILSLLVLAAAAVILVVPDAHAQQATGKGWTVEWEGKAANYPYKDAWRGNYTQANCVMYNDRTKEKHTYYGNFKVTERDR